MSLPVFVVVESVDRRDVEVGFEVEAEVDTEVKVCGVGMDVGKDDVDEGDDPDLKIFGKELGSGYGSACVLIKGVNENFFRYPDKNRDETEYKFQSSQLGSVWVR